MRHDIIELFTDIDDDLIAGAMPEAQRPIEVRADTRRFSWKKFAAAAACLAVVAVGGAFALKAVSGRGGLVSSENASSANPAGSTVSKPIENVVSKPASAGYPEEAKYQYTGDFSELELCQYAEVDRMAYYSFADLAGNSDLIVAGTFADDARQDCPTENWTYDPSYGASYNKLRIDKVFYGDVKIGDEIVIRDDTFVTNGKLMHIASSTLTPMIKGEQWVYFLRKQSPEYGDYYQPLFTEGRYPVPGNENTFVLTGDSTHGVFDERYFREDIYEEVKKKLGYFGGVEVIGEHLAADKEFIMPEFPGDKFIWKKEEMLVSRGGETASMLYEAPGILSVYLADLNGDGKRELISLCWEGVSGYITVYDYANSMLYPSLRPEAMRSYDLEIRDNKLYLLTQTNGDYRDLFSEPLTFDMFKPDTGSGSDNVEKIDRDDQTATKEFTMPEFPGDKFILSEKELFVPRGGEMVSTMFKTPGITSLYLADLNGDGKREMIAVQLDDWTEQSASFIAVYDHANAKLYPHRPGANKSYDLEIRDNELYVVTKTLDDGKEVSAEPLMDFLAKNPLVTNNPEFDDKTHVEKIECEDWTATKEFTMPEFPDDKFIWKEKQLLVSHGGTETVLYTVPGIISVYLADLNGDGKRELVILCRNSPGLTANELMVYDYANSKRYTIKSDTKSDTTLSYELEVRGNELYVVTRILGDYEAISSQPLTLDMLAPITRCGLD